MKVFLNVAPIDFLERQPKWWQTSELLDKLLDPVFASKYANQWVCFGYEMWEMDEPASRELVQQQMASRGDDATYYLGDTLSGDNWLLKLAFSETSIYVTLTCRGPQVNEHCSDLLDEMTELACRVHESFAGLAQIGISCGVDLMDREGYRRPRPPYHNPPWQLGSLVDIYSRDYHARVKHGRPGDLETLTSVTLPEGVTRSERGDLLILRWIDNVCDEERVAAARSQQHQWMGQTLGLTHHRNFNQLGDMRLSKLGMGQHDDLTFYDSSERKGFKATAAGPDGSVDEEMLAQLAAWKAAGELPDGNPIEQMNLIFPNRESVVALHERLRGKGFDRILYTDDNGDFWDIDPPGMWLEG